MVESESGEMNLLPIQIRLFRVILTGIIVFFVFYSFFLLIGNGNVSSLAAQGVASTRTPNSTDTWIATVISAKQMLALGRTQTVEAARRLPPRTPGTRVPIPTVEPNEVVTLDIPRIQTKAGAGTIDSHFGRVLPAWQGIGGNTWVETLGNKRLVVETAALRDDPTGVQSTAASQGVVFVWFETLDEKVLAYDGEYLSPVKAGLLTIVDARGERLILKAENGMTFYFDVPSRRFVSSLTEVVPTITPIVTPTPKPYP